MERGKNPPNAVPARIKSSTGPSTARAPFSSAPGTVNVDNGVGVDAPHLPKKPALPITERLPDDAFGFNAGFSLDVEDSDGLDDLRETEGDAAGVE